MYNKFSSFKASTTLAPITSTSTTTRPTTTSTTRPTSTTTIATTLATTQASTTRLTVTTPSTTGRTLPTLTSLSPQPSPTTQEPLVFRLPKSLSPTRYDILIQVDFNPYANTNESSTVGYLAYTGEEIIAFKAIESTNRIVLHSDRSIEITEIIVTHVDSSAPLTVSGTNYANNQLFEIDLTTNLLQNTNYTIRMKFKSITTRYGFIFHGYEEKNQRALVYSLNIL